MKLFRTEYQTGGGAWLPITYRSTKAEAVAQAKAFHKQATHRTAWRVWQCSVPNRLSVLEWAEVLRFDMLCPEVGDADTPADRTVTDFVTPDSIVSRSRQPKKGKTNGTK